MNLAGLRRQSGRSRLAGPVARDTVGDSAGRSGRERTQSEAVAGIKLKTPEEIERMRAAGRVVRKVLDHLHSICKPGVSTRELDEAGIAIIRESGGTSLFKNYPTYKPGEGFPSNLCISVNEVVVHGIAGDRQIEDGDIVSVDCGVLLDGWCGDAATTIEVGNVARETRELCAATRQVLDIAINNIQPGRTWSTIARLMQNYAKNRGYGVVENYVGHGVGRKLHEEPQVPNYVSDQLRRHDIVLREGMVLAIEPMCNMGTKETTTLSDGWTVKTADNRPSAHYEHTVAVAANGADVLTDGR